MNVLIDTNVVLDVLLKREPFFKHSQLVLLAAEKRHIRGHVSASAVTDIFYVAGKFLKDTNAIYSLMKRLLTRTLEVATVNRAIISVALEAGWKDFEDCIQYAVGDSIAADYIVTRNPNDFVEKNIPVVTPDMLLDIVFPE